MTDTNIAYAQRRAAAYRITLYENVGDKHTILFACQAESLDHAKEQALNAYPAARITTIKG
jgi:hypothetical protein